MEREVRYCTTEDGVRIACTIEGEGPALVVPSFLFESFLLERLVPEYQAMMRRLGGGRQVVRYDNRGTGSSQRNVLDVSLDAFVSDLEAVIQATGLRRFSLLGLGVFGGPVAITFAARHPRQVDRLVLYGTAASFPDAANRGLFQSLAQMARVNWGMAARSMADLSSRRHFGLAGLKVADWYEQSATGEEVARLFETAIGIDVSAMLPDVRSPTLVMHR